ncbi:hypothetical protein GCM10025868_32970 [Angustibacter aerolatus]|uniref:Uncharacterized protein n=1 Tax=Angustibacter aerolatus TaxID=1162965 RepID=A0ABQ6JIH9_9ACTN|nr:hypothetical protein GCM10025868_32970 [Angustibacter aerolatus]
MIRPVPAVMTITIMPMVTMESFGTMSAEQPENRAPPRAVATRVVDCRIARPMVR